MTSVAPVQFVTPAIAPSLAPVSTTPDPTAGTMPEPLLLGMEPHDALSAMLVSLERASQASLTSTETSVRATREDIKEQLDKFLEQIRAAAEAAKEEDSGGWFSDLIGGVANLIGSIVGAAADVFCDYVAFPVEATIDIASNIGNSQAVWAALQSDLADFGTTGEAGQAVKGFTSGVVKFTADAAAFGAKLSVAMARPGASPSEVWDAMKDDVKELGKSLDKNILSNPDFWKVVSAAAKVAAVAGTAASGGALGVVCIALMAASEIDQRTGILEKKLGAKAAMYVRAGLQIGAAVTGAFAGSGGSAFVQTVRSATQITLGAGAIAQGVKSLLVGNDNADQIDRQAELTTTLNRMQQLQRLCEDLLDTLQDKSKNQTTQREMGSELVQTQGATEAAAVVRA